MKTTTFLVLTLLALSGCATRSDGGARVRPLTNDPSALSSGIPLDDGNIPPAQMSGDGDVQFPSYAGFDDTNDFYGNKPRSTTAPTQQVAVSNNPAPLIPARADQPQAAGQTYQGSQDQKTEAVQKLLNEANTAVKANQLERAATALNRAVGIEPNNASIWYDLAQIRLHQGKYDQSEQLAKKSIDFAKGNQNLVNKNWRVISSARKANGNTAGADEAMRNAQ